MIDWSLGYISIFMQQIYNFKILPILNLDKSSQNTWVLISPYPDQEGNNLGSMSGTRAISTTSRRELSPSFLQGKAPKEI